MNQLHSGGTVGSLIIDAVRRYADRPALSDGVTSWTYAELGREIGRIVSFYRSLGLGPGSGVVMVTGNRVEAWAAQCAANLMGVRHTNLHPMSGLDDHAHVAADAEADVLIVDSRRFAARAAELKAKVPGLRHVLSFGPAEGARDLLAEAARLGPAPLETACVPEDPLLLVYTGGTTGRSKGVVLPHRSIAAMSAIQAAEWEWPRPLRYLASTPISHSGGIKIYTVMSLGGYARLLDGFDAETFCRTVAEERISATFLVPTVISTLLEKHDLRSKYDLSSLDLIIYGAAPMSPDRLRLATEAFGPVFLQLYGQSEAPECVTTLRQVDHDLAKPERLGSCGRPTLLTEVRLFDAEMREVAVGEPGEICVRGPLVMAGYWKQPALTDEVFRGGWLHTGDVARSDEEGYLYIVDRTKDMIISGGFNIYPREVEDALMSHPDVVLAGVVGIPDPKWGEAVKAFCVLRESAEVGVEALREHVKARRGGPWAPKSIDIVAELPLTGLGKLDRKALRAPYWSDQSRSVA